MATEMFSQIQQLQYPAHCGASSLSACLAILGIDASQRAIAHLAGKPWRIYSEGMDEDEIAAVAGKLGAHAKIITETRRGHGEAFAVTLRAHLKRDLPAILLVADMAHWLVVLGRSDEKFILMDPNDRGRAFERWSQKRLLSEGWNKGDDEIPSQYQAILLQRADGQPAKWKMTDVFVRLCTVGSMDTADQMAKDLMEMVDRAGGSEEDVPLEGVLEKHAKTVVRSVNHWTAQSQVSKADLKNLYHDYQVVAAAAGLRIAKDASEVELVAQMSVVLSTFAWTGEL
jgi:hypothetical protein